MANIARRTDEYFPLTLTVLAPRDFDTVTCSENNASVTWTGVPSNEFVLTDDVSIWGYCLNGSNRTTVR